MHRGAPNLHRSRGGQPLAPLGQRGVGLLVVEILNNPQIRTKLPWVSPAMRLGLHTACSPVPLQMIVDKAQTHPKEAGQVPL